MFYGLWVLLGQPFLKLSIESGLRKWRRKRSIKRLNQLNDTSNVEKHSIEKSKIYNHLHLLITSTKKGERNISVTNFLIITSIIFLVTLITMYSVFEDLVFTSLISFAFATMPYLILRFKLTSKRLNTSMGFLMEYHMILQNYQSTNKNMYFTIMNLVKDMENRELKFTFIKLLSALQKERNEESFKQAVNVFVYSIDSTFAKRFGKLLIKAHIDNADISQSLMDLNHDIKKRKQDMEADKTQKVETVIMGYAPLVLHPLFFFMAYRISGVVDFWYMFTQKLPLSIYTISIILSIISVCSAYLLSKPRADI
jgi:hypothetical protein